MCPTRYILHYIENLVVFQNQKIGLKIEIFHSNSFLLTIPILGPENEECSNKEPCSRIVDSSVVPSNATHLQVDRKDASIEKANDAEKEGIFETCKSSVTSINILRQVSISSNVLYETF